jgi:hypothetical protein
MADWVPPDKYEGTLLSSGPPVSPPAPPAVVEEPAFDRITAAIERQGCLGHDDQPI